MPYIQNPAFSGFEKDTDIKLGYKRQWTAFAGAPKDYFLGINHSFDRVTTDSLLNAKPQRKTGISGYIANSDFNLTNNFKSSLGYAVHIPLTMKYTLAFGLAANFEQSKITTDQLIVRDQQDAMYTNLVNAGGKIRYFNIDAGAVFYSTRFSAGYSAVRMVRTRLGNDLSGSTKSAMRHTFMISYSHFLNPTWEIQPSMLMRIENGLDKLFNIGVRTRYKSMISAGVAWSIRESVSVIAGYEFKNNITFGYCYDFNTGALNKASRGSHEVIVGIKPFKKFR
jgi:type IX secretion system PorP/SprF family membrane protein